MSSTHLYDLRTAYSLAFHPVCSCRIENRTNRLLHISYIIIIAPDGPNGSAATNHPAGHRRRAFQRWRDNNIILLLLIAYHLHVFSYTISLVDYPTLNGHNAEGGHGKYPYIRATSLPHEHQWAAWLWRRHYSCRRSTLEVSLHIFLYCSFFFFFACYYYSIIVVVFDFFFFDFSF